MIALTRKLVTGVVAGLFALPGAAADDRATHEQVLVFLQEDGFISREAVVEVVRTERDANTDREWLLVIDTGNQTVCSFLLDHRADTTTPVAREVIPVRTPAERI